MVDYEGNKFYRRSLGKNTCNFSHMRFNNGDDISYCVTGVYNSGSDCADIDVDALLELINYCKNIVAFESEL